MLAIFLAIPPIVQVLPLRHDFWLWFTNLTWVRFITSRRRTSGSPEHEKHSEKDVKEASPDLATIATLPSNPAKDSGEIGPVTGEIDLEVQADKGISETVRPK
jgi:hypothetical protein